MGQAFLQPNAQIQGAFGGNANLQEEVADTWTAGVILRPRFIPRLNITVDYYDIEIDQAIAAAGGGVNNILNLCYNVIQDASSAICGLITRDPQGIISGPPFIVSANNANLGGADHGGHRLPGRLQPAARVQHHRRRRIAAELLLPRQLFVEATSSR